MRRAIVLALASIASVASAAAAAPEASGGRAPLFDLGSGGRPELAGRPGNVAFRTAAGWFRATRVIEGAGTSEVLLATNDPAGRRMRLAYVPYDNRRLLYFVRVRVAGDRTGVSGIRIGFGAQPEERYLGFGERSNAVDQTGNEVENYVAEGPFEDDERALIPSFVPPWAFRPRPDATYFPIPWLLSSRGHGVLVDNPQRSVFRLRRRAWSVEVDTSRRLELRIFAGPRPADALRRFTRFTGRQPRPPSPAVLGPWYQPRDDERQILARLQDEDVPLSLAQTYTHYLPCAEQTGRRDEERARVRHLHRRGLAVTTYFNPMICTSHPDYARGLADGEITPETYRYSTLESFEVGQFRFLPGQTLFRRLLGEARADGHDGWMEDFGEYTPPALKVPDGTTLHNVYPTRYHCAARDAARRAIRYVRSGWTGTARCAPVVWGGDPTVDWGFDGLHSVVTNGLSMGLSGVSTWGSDIGGFFALFENRLTPELLVRWIQAGAVSGVMRTQANGIRVPDSPRPQIWDPEVQPLWRRYAKLRTQLYPYLAAADASYRRSGLPIMRHLVLAYPRDRRALAAEDEFLFGPDLLAAPVLEPGATRRSLYLPRGLWVDLWRAAAYTERDGGLELGRARMLRGPRRVTLPAPLAELPLLARAGTLLALLDPGVDTLAPYGDRAPVTSLGESEGRRVLLAFPRGRSSARLEDGGRLHSREARRAWTLTVDSRRTRRWSVQASLATLERPFRPCRVSAVGGRLAGWSYDRRTRVLRATLTTRRGRLLVRGCP